ncbi:MAG TPA: PilZ domain-containing protein [Nitrospira sp.]|nr:PilZ domain-containing protein [Nitrospira sp.]
MIKTLHEGITVKLENADPLQDGRDGEQASDVFLDRRGAERAPIECPVSFTSEERFDDWSKAEGTLCDLSKTGCQISTFRPPLQGSQITLTLLLPDGLPPMRLIGTTVRHVRGRVFGAEFLPLTPEERRRLQTLIFKHLTWSVYSLRRPAFRIAEQ